MLVAWPNQVAAFYIVVPSVLLGSTAKGEWFSGLGTSKVLELFSRFRICAIRKYQLPCPMVRRISDKLSHLPFGRSLALL